MSTIAVDSLRKVFAKTTESFWGRTSLNRNMTTGIELQTVQPYNMTILGKSRNLQNSIAGECKSNTSDKSPNTSTTEGTLLALLISRDILSQEGIIILDKLKIILIRYHA